MAGKSLKDLIIIPDRAPIPSYLLKKDAQESFLNAVFPEDNGIHTENRLVRILGSLAKHATGARNAVIVQQDLGKVLGMSSTIRTQFEQLASRMEKLGYATTYRDPADGTVSTLWLHDKKAPDAPAGPAPKDIDTAAPLAKAHELLLQSAFSRGQAIFSKEEIFRSLPPEPKLPFDLVERAFLKLCTSDDGLPVFFTMTDRDNRTLGYFARARLLHAFFQSTWDAERSRLFEAQVEAVLQEENASGRVLVGEASLGSEARWFIAKITELMVRFPTREAFLEKVLTLPFTDDNHVWDFLAAPDLLDKADAVLKAFGSAKIGGETKVSSLAVLFQLSPDRIAQEAKRRAGGWLSRRVYQRYASRIAQARNQAELTAILNGKVFLVFMKENFLNDYLAGLLARRAAECEERLKNPRPRNAGVTPRSARPAPAEEKEKAAPATAPRVPLERVYRALGFLDYEKPSSLEEVPSLIEAAMKSWREHSSKPQKDRDALVAELQKKVNVLKKVANPSEEAIRNFYNGIRSFYKNDKEQTHWFPVLKYMVITALCA